MKLVSRSKKLIDRYFPSVQQEEALERERREAEALSAEKVEEFLNCAYMPEFRRLLKETIAANKPRPGDKDDMVYRCGFRDGIEAVEAVLEGLELTQIRRKHERVQSG